MSDVRIPTATGDQAVSNVPLWRYMDFIKFASLVEMGALWFSRLGALQDGYEGTIPEPSYLEMTQRDQDVATWRDDPGWKAAAAEMTLRNESDGRDILAVNCWNMNKTEDRRMWKTYTSDAFGVVIKTTLGRLRRVIPVNDFTFIGAVNYVDLATHQMDLSDAHSASKRAFLKSPTFAFENELRVVTMNIVTPYCLNADGTPMTKKQATGPGQLDNRRPGLYVKVDLKTLLRLVIVSPKSPPWFYSLVKTMVSNHGLTAPVERSRFADEAAASGSGGLMSTVET